MKNARRTELIVGAFVVVAVAIVMYLIIQMGERFFVSQYTVTAYFENAAGLSPGVTVTLAGVPIGDVRSVRLLTAAEVRKLNRTGTLVEVVLQIEYKYEIPIDSELTLTRTAILGEQALTFSETKTMQYHPRDGTAIVWCTKMPPSATDQILMVFTDIKKDFGRLIGNINAIIGDKQFQKNLKATNANIAAVTEKAKALTDNAAAAAHSIDAFLASARDLIEGETFQSILQKTNSIATSLEEALSPERVRSTAENLERSAQEFQTLLSRLNTSVEQQEGFLGTLLKDEEFNAQIKQTVKALRQSAVEMRDAILRVSSAVDEIRRLSEFLRRNPSAIIWGQPRGAGPSYLPAPPNTP